MNKLLRLAPLALAIAASGVSAQSTDDTLTRMQQQLNSMQQQLNAAKNDRVRFNGFFSTGVARASNDAGFAGNTEKTNVADLSLLALLSFSEGNRTECQESVAPCPGHWASWPSRRHKEPSC
ncbi:MAG: hypothetical protein ACTHWH_04135 [Marinobacter sp.]